MTDGRAAGASVKLDRRRVTHLTLKVEDHTFAIDGRYEDGRGSLSAVVRDADDIAVREAPSSGLREEAEVGENHRGARCAYKFCSPPCQQAHKLGLRHR